MGEGKGYVVATFQRRIQLSQPDVFIYRSAGHGCLLSHTCPAVITAVCMAAACLLLRRATGTTLMNEASSRSHAICTITLTQSFGTTPQVWP